MTDAATVTPATVTTDAGDATWTVTTSDRHPHRDSVTVTADGVTPAGVTAATRAGVTPGGDAPATVTASPVTTVTRPRRPAMTVTTRPARTVTATHPDTVTTPRIPKARHGLRGDMSLDRFLAYYTVTLAVAGGAGAALYHLI